MKILTTEQVKQADKYTIEHEPIASIDLMERAASRAAQWILEQFGADNDYAIFVGPGNNGGDGLVIARHIDKAQRKENLTNKVTVYFVKFSDKMSPDFKTNLDRLNNTNVTVHYITQADDFPQLTEDHIIIDAIFGSGLNRPVKGLAAQVIEKINQSPKKFVISIDIPSGLFGEENHREPQVIVKADITITFEFPFLSFFFPENEDYVGEFVVIPIGIHPEFIEKVETNYFTVEPGELAEIIKPRKRFAHKGNFGHGLLVAGKYGTMGAAVLAARAAHRTGIGLLTAHVPQKCVDIMQISSPETIVQIDELNDKVSAYIDNLDKFNAIGIGPGIGLIQEPALLLRDLLHKGKNKLFVIDADAITILGQHKDWLEDLPANAILTPHPKEFERIAGQTPNNYQRLQRQIEFSKKYNVIVVLKGAYTSISLPDGRVFFNVSGNPGMATGGSGDVLTGMILSLLAQGYEPEDAAKLGVYLHGLAGDIAALDIGEISLLPGDIIEAIPDAYQELLGIE